MPYVVDEHEHEHEHEHIVLEIWKSATAKQQHAKIMCKHTNYGDIHTFLLCLLGERGKAKGKRSKNNASDEF